jgi:hypothetical protein
VPTRELGVQTAMLLYKLFGGSVHAGIPGDPTNMFAYTGPRGIRVRAPKLLHHTSSTTQVPLLALKSWHLQMHDARTSRMLVERILPIQARRSRNPIPAPQVKGCLDKEEVLRAKTNGFLFAATVVVGTPQCLAELCAAPAAFRLMPCVRAVAVDEMDAYSQARACGVSVFIGF